MVKHRTDNDMIDIILTVIGTGVATSLLTWLLNRKINKAKVEDTHANTIQTLTDNYLKVLKQLECVKSRLKRMDEEKRELKRRMEILEDRHKSAILYNDVLVRRIHLLARILTKLFTIDNGSDIDIEDFLGDSNVSTDDKVFLEKIVEEAKDE